MHASVDRCLERLARPPVLGGEEDDAALFLDGFWRDPEARLLGEAREAAHDPQVRRAFAGFVSTWLRHADPGLPGARVLTTALRVLHEIEAVARELLPSLREHLADRRDAHPLRVASASVVLSLDDEPRTRAFCVHFVDEVLATGDCREAFARAAEVYAERRGSHHVPGAPASRGCRRVRGNEDLCFEPYCYRQTLDDVLRALAVRARGERRLLPWLVEGAKLWSIEREIALAGLRDAAPTDEELASAFAELCRFAAQAPTRERVEPLRSALAVGNDARWLAVLLAQLDACPAACDALSEWLTRAPEVATATESWRERLVALADRARQPAVQVLAYAAAGGSEQTAAAVLDAMPAGLAPVVVARAIQARAFGPQVATSCERALGRLDEDEAQERADVATLSWNCRQAARRLDGTPWPGTRLLEPWPLGDALIVPYHRVVTRAPPSEWSNDEDEFGVIVLARDGTAARIRLPMSLPIQRNGAHGAKRSIEANGGHQGELWLTMSSPFCDDRGWGNELYLWSFRAPGTFRPWTRSNDALAPAAVGAAPEPIGYGELILWLSDGELAFAIDDTPYHLDDWTRRPDVVAALNARDEARAREAAARLPAAREVSWDTLGLARPLGAEELRTVWTGRLGQREIVLADASSPFGPELALVLVDGRPAHTT